MKPKKPILINNKEQLNHLIAPDMFAEGHIQVFHAKTGNWLGTIKEGQEVPELPFTEQTEDPQEEKEIINPNQINLF